jgi:transposase-like protein
MAIWADGRSELLHYEVADGESEATWNRLFKNLIARGFDVNALKLVSSDGSLGIPQAINNYFLTLTFYQFDESLHKHIRTTNHLERLFREFRTKSDEIGVFPNEISCLTVFWLVVQRDHAKYDRFTTANNS